MNFTKTVNCTNLNKSKFPLKIFLDTNDKNPFSYKSKTILIGLSGGADSVMMLYLFKNLLNLGEINELVAVHINHGTRQECHFEENFVKNLCSNLDIPLFISRLSLDASVSSFENIAREKRYVEFEKYLKKYQIKDLENVFFATGHHLNDSFEWSLMQTFKSSSLLPLRGIPKRRGLFIRPMLCFTKKEILSFCKEHKLDFVSDLTNFCNNHERNYIRNIIIPLIEKRYPKFLKHFELRSLFMTNQESQSSLYIHHDPLGGVLIQYEQFNEEVNLEIKKAFINISKIGRSSISLEISKISKALINGKQGPLNFPANISIFLLRKTIYLISNEQLKKYEGLDQKLLTFVLATIKLQKQQLTQAKNYTFIREDLFFPQIMLIGKESSIQEVLKFHPLLPKTTKYLLQNKIRFTYYCRVLDNYSDLFPICLWTALAKS